MLPGGLGQLGPAPAAPIPTAHRRFATTADKTHQSGSPGTAIAASGAGYIPASPSRSSTRLASPHPAPARSRYARPPPPRRQLHLRRHHPLRQHSRSGRHPQDRGLRRNIADQGSDHLRPHIDHLRLHDLAPIDTPCRLPSAFVRGLPPCLELNTECSVGLPGRLLPRVRATELGRVPPRRSRSPGCPRPDQPCR
jgi:hypothetical protein